MEIIKVYSPIDDKNIHQNLNDSPIWKSAYHQDELSDAKLKHPSLHEYSIKFEGLKPVFVTNVKKITK